MISHALLSLGLITCLLGLFIIFHIICWYCYMNTTDKWDLSILLISLCGQTGGIIGIIGTIFRPHNNLFMILVNFAHYCLVATILLGLFLFSELHNEIYITTIITVILISRLYLGYCVFDCISVFEFPKFFIDYNYMFLAMIVYKIVYAISPYLEPLHTHTLPLKDEL